MKRGQRVVKSMPDRAGNAYTKTAAGGKQRMQAAVRYMDERENTQLYTYERGELRETDRHHAVAKIEDTQTKYQQHVAFTTELKSGNTYTNHREAADHVARAIQERRPDAEIYAIAVHADGQHGERHVHVHACFGTNTTLRRDDLKNFREQAYQLEQVLERENSRDQDQQRDQSRDLEYDQGRDLETPNLPDAAKSTTSELSIPIPEL